MLEQKLVTNLPPGAHDYIISRACSSFGWPMNRGANFTSPTFRKEFRLLDNTYSDPTGRVY